MCDDKNVRGLITGKAVDNSVYINGVKLCVKDSKKVVNHSPVGFAWGYGGSGPAQLALAILLKFTNKDVALKLYQKFKWHVISYLPIGKDFSFPIERVISFIEGNSRGMV